jgi:hypothetical protein
MTITTTCRACNHPGVAQIDAAILAGMSKMAIGRIFDLHRKTVERHETNGHVAVRGVRGPHAPQAPLEPAFSPRRAPEAPAQPPVEGDGTALGEMQALVANLKATPTDGLSPVAALALAREKRLAVVELSKIAGPPPPAHSPMDSWPTLRRILLDALEGEPRARQKVADAIRAYESSAD